MGTDGVNQISHVSGRWKSNVTCEPMM